MFLAMKCFRVRRTKYLQEVQQNLQHDSMPFISQYLVCSLKSSLSVWPFLIWLLDPDSLFTSDTTFTLPFLLLVFSTYEVEKYSIDFRTLRQVYSIKILLVLRY